MLNLKPGTAIVAATIGILVSEIPMAHATILDSTDITIGMPNAALSGFAGP